MRITTIWSYIWNHHIRSNSKSMQAHTWNQGYFAKFIHVLGLSHLLALLFDTNRLPSAIILIGLVLIYHFDLSIYMWSSWEGEVLATGSPRIDNYRIRNPVNSLAARERWGSNFTIFKLILRIDILGACCGNCLRWIPQNPIDIKPTLFQVIAWCRQTTDHCLSLCWLRSMSPFGVTTKQWVSLLGAETRISRQTRSISWLLMPWVVAVLGHNIWLVYLLIRFGILKVRVTS